MKLLILILIVIALIFIQEWITRRRLRKVRRLLGKVECVKTTLPTGEVEMLGPGKVLIEDKQKVGTITGSSLRSNEELKKRVIGPLIKKASAFLADVIDILYFWLCD